MTVLVDTSVVIDYLRGRPGAVDLLEEERCLNVLHASEITRLEVLAGMRPVEEGPTRSLLSTFLWHPVDARVPRRPAPSAGDGCPATTPSPQTTWPSPPRP